MYYQQTRITSNKRLQVTKKEKAGKEINLKELLKYQKINQQPRVTKSLPPKKTKMKKGGHMR